MTKRCYILLGRVGDLLSALPILYADSQAGELPIVLTCREHTGLFSGVSYADVVAFDGLETDLRGACEQASKIAEEVKCLQVIGDTASVKDLTYGPAGFDKAQTDSFQKEPYKLLGKSALWSAQPRPVFDRRDKSREEKLSKLLPAKPSKCILVAPTGKSSPFPYGDLLFELLRSRFRKFNVVDLSNIQAEHFYDFLGMLETAHCLVTVDSAFLHLAHGCQSLPVVALVNDKPSLWHGSAWRANHIAHIRYGDFPFRAVEMLDAIQIIGDWGSYPLKDPLNGEAAFVHVWSQYELTDENQARHKTALDSWKYQSLQSNKRWISCKIEVGAFGRDSKFSTATKDTTRVPFLKNVIQAASHRARDNDVILLTRSDSTFVSESAALDSALINYSPCYAHRNLIHDCGETWHPSIDLFAFTKKWWLEHQNECPDFFMGTDQYWGRGLMALINKYGGKEISNVIFREPSTATAPGGRRKFHNEFRHNEWERDNGPIHLAPPVAEQLPTVVVNRHALQNYGYNPSIIRHGDRLLMAYRWHDQRNESTALAIAQIDEQGNVMRNWPIKIPHGGGSEEDARFFKRGDDLYLSYVDSTWPTMPSKSVVKYSRLVEENAAWSLENIEQPKWGQNDMTAMEKNWLLFDHKGKLFCFYGFSGYSLDSSNRAPNQTTLIELEGSNARLVAEYPSLRWPYGPIRGGTTPLPYKGMLLTFFQSSLDYEIPPYRRRYFTGAMTMENEPPFRPIAASKKPVLWGSETDTLSEIERSSCQHYKPKCALPFGAIDLGVGKFLCSVGINDSHCGLVTISEGDLHL